ncbi:DUF1330 domain-containing protein [Mycobacterium sp. UM_WWY]
MAIETTRDQVRRLQALPADQPVVMVNLLKFRPDGGAESYARYAAAVEPHLRRVGATVVYGGTERAMIIGEADEPEWDVILLVQYPTPGAFLEMVTDPGYSEVHEHRVHALERAELIATTAWNPAGP